MTKDKPAAHPPDSRSEALLCRALVDAEATWLGLIAHNAWKLWESQRDDPKDSTINAET